MVRDLFVAFTKCVIPERENEISHAEYYQFDPAGDRENENEYIGITIDHRTGCKFAHWVKKRDGKWNTARDQYGRFFVLVLAGQKWQEVSQEEFNQRWNSNFTEEDKRLMSQYRCWKTRDDHVF